MAAKQPRKLCQICTFLLEATGRMTENRHVIIRAAFPAPLEAIEHWVPRLTPSPAEAKSSYGTSTLEHKGTLYMFVQGASSPVSSVGYA